MRVPDIFDIEDAARRLAPILRKTSLFESERLNSHIGGRLLVKAETIQPTGSFKVRGAWNRIAQLSPEELSRGVLALSSGNHGLAVAWAARAAGVRRAVVLMPADAPTTKIEQTRSLGAQVVVYDRRKADRAALVAEWQNEGLVFIPAFDDPQIIAGAATAAYEVAQEAASAGIAIDVFVAACSGGGLVAGSALALRALSPTTEIWGVEPEAYDDTARSLSAGDRISVPASGVTICDALLSLIPGELTFEINRSGLSGIVRGSDDDARKGMKGAFEFFGLVAEPSGALALGAILAGKFETEGRTVAVILSGRNVDLDLYLRELAHPG